jgi:hypothetical protein
MSLVVTLLILRPSLSLFKKVVTVVSTFSGSTLVAGTLTHSETT